MIVFIAVALVAFVCGFMVGVAWVCVEIIMREKNQ